MDIIPDKRKVVGLIERASYSTVNSAGQDRNLAEPWV
jgi:hypothetical protein